MSIQRFIFQYIASQITQSIKSEILNKSGTLKRPVSNEEKQLTCESAPQQNKAEKSTEENAVDAGFIFAMPMEAVGITDFFQNRKILKAAKRKFTTGRLCCTDTVFNAVSVISGVGQKNAAEAAESLIDAFHPKKIISAGYSGGLSKQLKQLMVCFPEAVISEDSGKVIDLSNAFPQYLPEVETAENKLTLLTVNSAVMSPSAKRELYKLYKTTGAELVDMETFAVAEVCLQRHLPFLSVRIILDAADEEFPKDVQKITQKFSSNTLFNEQGVLTPRLAGTLLGTFVKRPSVFTDLYSLKRKTAAAAEKLAKYIMRELSSGG